MKSPTKQELKEHVKECEHCQYWYGKYLNEKKNNTGVKND